MTGSSVLTAILVFSIAATLYFAVWNTLQIIMGVMASGYLVRHKRRHTRRARALAGHLAAPPLVTIVVPAYNEALTIVDSVRALLALDYESREIVVVNDGSVDDTLAQMTRAFQLVPAPVAFVQSIRTEPVRGVYRSISEPRVVLIDKDNGGCKADATNAGINAASGPLVLIIDADTILEPDAISRAVLPFLEDPAMVAVGANVGIANGCRIDDGGITRVAFPRNWFARFQIVDYMRAFLLFRLACAAVNGVPIISGAFGLFRRDAVLAVGGYDRTAIGEDLDLTLRVQEHYRRRKEPIRITFDPNVLCWTQVPEDWRSLRGQRTRWRRGLLQVLWCRRGMFGNPRYGVVGLGVLPYFAILEGLGPLVEISGYVVTTAAVVTGILNWQFYGLLMAITLLFGCASTLLAVLLSDVATRRYMRGRELLLLVAIAVLENFGYRQLISWWGCVGTVQAWTGKGGWGVMKRRAFKRGEPQASASTR